MDTDKTNLNIPTLPANIAAILDEASVPDGSHSAAYDFKAGMLKLIVTKTGVVVREEEWPRSWGAAMIRQALEQAGAGGLVAPGVLTVMAPP